MKTIKTRYKKNFSFSILFLFICSSIRPANLIFDMDGVVVKQSRFYACLTVGLSKFLGFYNPFALDQQLFEFLNLLEPHRPETPAAVHRGQRLPQIMCDWLTGHKTTAEIRSLVEKGLEKHDNFFISNSQKALIAGLCDFMFTPEKLVNAIYPVRDTLKLIKKCAKKTDKFGNKNRIFILTNWDAESFGLLYKSKPLRKLFGRCHGIIVSGCVNLMKPDHAIYKYLLSEYAIDPSQELTVFVDDTPANVEAAKQCGIHAIHCKNLNIHAVEKEFRSLGVL